MYCQRNVKSREKCNRSPLDTSRAEERKVPGTIDVDLNVYQADPAVDGTTFLDAQYLLDKLGPLQPSNTFDYKAKGRSPKFVDTVDYHRNRP